MKTKIVFVILAIIISVLMVFVVYAAFHSDRFIHEKSTTHYLWALDGEEIDCWTTYEDNRYVVTACYVLFALMGPAISLCGYAIIKRR